MFKSEIYVCFLLLLNDPIFILLLLFSTLKIKVKLTHFHPEVIPCFHVVDTESMQVSDDKNTCMEYRKLLIKIRKLNTFLVKLKEISQTLLSE
jgi:hypothetical protein